MQYRIFVGEVTFKRATLTIVTGTVVVVQRRKVKPVVKLTVRSRLKHKRDYGKSSGVISVQNNLVFVNVWCFYHIPSRKCGFFSYVHRGNAVLVDQFTFTVREVVSGIPLIPCVNY